jgi:tetratricopeptide (TPR) repeat protein
LSIVWFSEGGTVFKSFYLVMFVLAATGIAAAQGTTLSVERDAYTAANHRKDAEAKAKALELFLKNYSDSELKERALETLLETYRRTRSPKAWDTLDQLLKINADNLYGLTVKANLRCDDEPRPGMCDAEESELADHGLRVLAAATKPEYMSETDFAMRKAQAALAFHSLAGAVAVVRRDYLTAEQHFRIAVELDPTNFGSVYPLAIACLRTEPPDTVSALFFLARAASLVEPGRHKQIMTYGKTEYVKYHGSERGWPELLKLAKTSTTMPAGFVISPARETP